MSLGSIGLGIGVNRGGLLDAVLTLLGIANGETDALALDNVLTTALIKDSGVPANDVNSTGRISSGALVGPGSVLTNTAPGHKLTRQSDGVLRFQAHNLYLNSAAPANQNITVISGATYAITITGSVSITLTGAHTAVVTAGTTEFTAASTTLMCTLTSGSGTVHVRRTPSASDYLATTSAAVYDLPYEWDSAGDLRGVRVESQNATNLFTRSMQFDDASWTKALCTVSADAVASPSGLTDADKVIPNNGATLGAALLQKSVTVAANTFYVFSAFFKPGEHDRVRLMCQESGTSNYVRAYADLTDGSEYAALLDPGDFTEGMLRTFQMANGWWRAALYFRTGALSTSTTLLCKIEIDDSVDTLGDGSSGLYAWGAQLEAGNAASSFIPTLSATVTRPQDQLTLATSAFPWAAGPGTLFWKGYNLENDDGAGTGLLGISQLVSVYANISTDGLALAVSNSSTRAYRGCLTMRDNAGLNKFVETADGDLTPHVLASVAAAFDDTTEGDISANGETSVSSTALDFPGTNALTALRIGFSHNAIVQQIAYFPRRFSTAELEALAGIL